MKSSLFFAGAVVAFLVSGILSAAAFFKIPWATNPYIILATILAVVLFFIGSMFKYTPMKRYLANCILQKDAIKKVKNWKQLDDNTITENFFVKK